jgi:hypothetical protein
MKYAKLALLNKLQNVPRQGWTWQKVKDLVDSLWRDEIWVKNIIYKFLPTPADGIVSGGIVTWLTGLTFAVSQTIYYLGGRLYFAPSTTVTLNEADATNPRIDVFTVNSDSSVEVIEGTPAAEPQKPSIDPATHLELTFVLIPANATEPPTITDEIVYNENTEWTPVASGITVNFNAATSPYTGSKCADVGAIGNNDTITFTAALPNNFTDYENISLWLKLKANPATQHKLYVRFLLSGIAVSTEIEILFERANTTTWQNIALALSAFTFTGETFDAVRLRWSKSGANVDFTGFYLDYIKLQRGITPPPVATDTYTTALTFNDTTRELALVQNNNRPVLKVTIPGGEGGGEPGEDGREVEMSVEGGYVVWRYVGDVSWTNLVALSAITGPPGSDGEDGATGAPGADGTDGREIELRENAGWVEWRYIGDATWTQLYEIPEGGGGGASVIQVTGTLVVANWVTDGSLKKYVLSNANITATSSVEVIPANSSYDVLVAAEPMPETESAAGTVTMWVKNTPSADIPVTINITEIA